MTLSRQAKYYPQAVVDYVWERIDQSKSGELPPITAWKNAVDFMKYHKIPMVRKMNPDLLMVHEAIVVACL